MKSSELHPELRRAYAWIPALPFHNRAALYGLTLLQKIMPKGNRVGDGVAVEDVRFGEAGTAEPPDYAVPARRESLAGLPPAWICVGEVDLFHAEDVAYAQRLRADGVGCELLTFPGAPHAYDLVVPQASMSRSTVDGYCSFLRERLGA